MKEILPEDVCNDRVFQQLFVRHSKDLYAFLHHKYGPGHNPADVVQEAFLKLWDNCHKVPPEKARGFLFTVANNAMLNQLAREKTARKYQDEPQQRHTNEHPEFVMAEKEFGNRLEKALQELSEDQRVTLMLNRAEGKTHKEIAAILGISQKAVEKRIYKSLAILREKIEGIQNI